MSAKKKVTKKPTRKKAARKKINTACATHGIERLHSGSIMLDCALGGGWALGRVLNIVGDRSTGKTLLMIEACANFRKKFPEGKIIYAEAEAAFDETYAESIGFPPEAVEFPPVFTVEDVYKKLKEVVEESDGTPAFFVVDSLDALSDNAEMERELGDATYGTNKARTMSEMFRRINQLLEGSNVTLAIVSQVRDKIGVTFGRTTTRSGGRALDFYATQIIFLAKKTNIFRTIAKIKRAIGVTIIAKVDKNKAGVPFREVEFPLLFNYGIHNVRECCEFLKSADQLDRIDLNKDKMSAYYKGLDKLSREEYEEEQRDTARAAIAAWDEIEEGFKPPRSKYGSD